MRISPLKRLLFVVLMSGAVTAAFAEDAPVYDVDSYPPQFDGQADVTARSAAVTPKTQPLADNQTYASNQADSSNPPVDSQPSTLVQSPKPLTMEQRIQRLEQQNNNVLSSDYSTKLNDMQTEVQSLRGQVEDLTHQIQQLQTQQKNMYSDLDKRLGGRGNTPAAIDNNDSSTTDTAATQSAMSTDTVVDPVQKAKKPKKALTSVMADAKTHGDVAANSAVTDNQANTATESLTAAEKTDSQPNVAEEQQIYQTAYTLIKAKKYNEAATTLQKMLHKYPSGQFAANAHYWLGELYGLMGKNDQAILEFNNVVKNYPDSPKLADAQLKLGLLFAAQFKWAEAKSSFKKVINQYPGTSSAHLAAEQLKQIKQAGH